MRVLVIAMLIMGAVAGCSTHQPFIVAHRADVTNLQAGPAGPHDRPVRIIETDLPGHVAYERIADVDVARAWYASRDAARVQLAEAARELGADAVVDARVWLQPSGFAWAAPHARGVAVRWSNAESARVAAGLGAEF
ncbi:MAG: hypothetical protein R3233_03905 [Xanthomonadales bacterium]|nr:hypothetical protein [Xanthomonadales bacterium]